MIMTVESYLQSMPKDLYLEVKQFLNEYDYFKFMNSSKKNFQLIFYETRKIYIRKPAEIRKIVDNVEYRNYILEKVAYPALQLFFTLDEIGLPFEKLTEILVLEGFGIDLYYPTESFPILTDSMKRRQNLTLRSFSFSSIMPLPYATKISLLSCPSLVELNSLSLLKELCLFNCPKVYDVNCLASLHKLTLHGLPMLQNVDSLGRIFDLSLISCSSINSINGLTHNTKLTIISCKRIQDISPLKNPLQLTTDLIPDISRSGNINPKITSLHLENYRHHMLVSSATLRKLSLNRSTISDTSTFHSLRELVLSRCTKLVSLSSELTNIPILTFSSCSALNDISALIQNPKLNPRRIQFISFIQCPNIQSWSAVNGLPHVSISFCDGFTNIQEVNEVHYLQINGCRMFVSIPEKLQKIHHLELSNCPELQDISISNLEEVPIIEVNNCINITSFQRLTKNQKISISLPSSSSSPYQFPMNLFYSTHKELSQSFEAEKWVFLKKQNI